MLMNTDVDRRLRASWALAAWLLLILSGALTTSLLRAPLVLSSVMPSLVMWHLVGGAVIAILAIGQLIYASRVTRWWGVMLVAATPVCGWLAHRSFSPHLAATHAAAAAFATIALAGFRRGPRTDRVHPARRWATVLSRAGFILILLQLAAGAALRHHVIGLPWHLFLGGLATMAVLGSAVPTTQDQQTTLAEKRAAISVIAAIVVQVSLGTAVLFMIFLGPPNALTWITATVAHVVVGSVTLLAVGRFMWLLAGVPISSGGGGAS
jgi:hypothetical protein